MRMFLFLDLEFTDGQFQREEFKVKCKFLVFFMVSGNVPLSFTHTTLIFTSIAQIYSFEPK